MNPSFNPYEAWLGIEESGSRPNHYRILGLELFESDPEVIAQAATQVAARVRSIRPGENASAWSQLLDETNNAHEVLSSPASKSAYDQSLRTALAGNVQSSSAPPASQNPASAAATMWPPGMEPPGETPQATGPGQPTVKTDSSVDAYMPPPMAVKSQAPAAAEAAAPQSPGPQSPAPQPTADQQQVAAQQPIPQQPIPQQPIPQQPIPQQPIPQQPIPQQAAPQGPAAEQPIASVTPVDPAAPVVGNPAQDNVVQENLVQGQAAGQDPQYYHDPSAPSGAENHTAGNVSYNAPQDQAGHYPANQAAQQGYPQQGAAYQGQYDANQYYPAQQYQQPGNYAQQQYPGYQNPGEQYPQAGYPQAYGQPQQAYPQQAGPVAGMNVNPMAPVANPMAPVDSAVAPTHWKSAEPAEEKEREGDSADKQPESKSDQSEFPGHESQAPRRAPSEVLASRRGRKKKRSLLPIAVGSLVGCGLFVALILYLPTMREGMEVTAYEEKVDTRSIVAPRVSEPETFVSTPKVQGMELRPPVVRMGSEEQTRPATPQEEATIRKALAQAYLAMRNRDFGAEANPLKVAEQTAITQEHKLRVAQMKELSDHLGRFWFAVRDTMESASTGEELRVGSTPVSIVEADKDRVVIRILGKRQEYTIQQLPIAFAQALAEKRLNPGAPSTQIALGAFLYVDPKGDPNTALNIWDEASQRPEIEISHLTSLRGVDLLAEAAEASVVLPTEEEEPKLAAIPAEEDIRATEQKLHKEFQKQVQLATTPAAKYQLSRDILSAAKNPDESLVGRYVLFKAAIKLASLSGQPQVVLPIVDEMASVFEIDSLQIKAEAVYASEKYLNNDLGKKSLARSGNKLVEQALAAERIDAAKQLSDFAVEAAEKSDDGALLAAAKRYQDLIVRIKQGVASNPYAPEKKEEPKVTAKPVENIDIFASGNKPDEEMKKPSLPSFNGTEPDTSTTASNSPPGSFTFTEPAGSKPAPKGEAPLFEKLPLGTLGETQNKKPEEMKPEDKKEMAKPEENKTAPKPAPSGANPTPPKPGATPPKKPTGSTAPPLFEKLPLGTLGGGEQGKTPAPPMMKKPESSDKKATPPAKPEDKKAEENADE